MDGPVQPLGPGRPTTMSPCILPCHRKGSSSTLPSHCLFFDPSVSRGQSLLFSLFVASLFASVLVCLLCFALSSPLWAAAGWQPSDTLAFFPSFSLPFLLSVLHIVASSLSSSFLLPSTCFLHRYLTPSSPCCLFLFKHSFLNS